MPTSIPSAASSASSFIDRLAAWLSLAFVALLLAACGGGADAPPPPEGAPPALLPPTITQQPADITVSTTQTAAFTVVASGSAPLAYQWQRNGQDIDGATAATYTLPGFGEADNGAVFHITVSNAAGSVTSRDATLTISAGPAAVATLTQQPASVSVTAGSAASFTVAATCSSGAPALQWQRNSGTGGAFVAIAGASSLAYSLTPSLADNGAQFRAAVSCGGDGAITSDAATLTVTAPPQVILAPLAVNGLRDQADIDVSRGIVRETSGSYAFVSGNTVRRLAADLSSITLVAGSSNPQDPAAVVDGTGAAARFASPAGIAADGAGNLYVTEDSVHVIRRISSTGVVTTLAGNAGSAGQAEGSGSAARFNFPSGIAIGPEGDLYVADRGNQRVRRVTAAGVVSTYAGSGSFGYADGSAATAQFNLPEGIAVAADGTAYVSDSANSRIRRIARSGSAAGAVTTLAGNGSPSGNAGSADGIGSAAGIPAPGFMSLAGSTLYVRDFANLLRAIDTGSGAVTTVTGTRASPSDPLGLTPTFVDGPPGTARLDNFRGGVAAAGDGSLIITDNNVGAVRRVGADGTVTTIAMKAAFESFYQAAGSTGVLAQQPLAGSTLAFAPIAGAPDGSLLISDAYRIRRIAADGTVSSLIGLPLRWNIDGTGSGALLNSGAALTVGANGDAFFFDAFNIRRIDASNTSASLAGGAYGPVPSQSAPPPERGALDGSGGAARFDSVVALVPGANGELFAADQFNSAIRRIDAAGSVTTYAGALLQAGTADGPAASARFTQPIGLARTPDGSLWVLDGGRGAAAGTLRRIAPDGTVSSFTGLAYRIATDPAGTLYAISDAGELVTVDTATGAFTTLIPRGSALTFGASPALGGTGGLTAVGVKQLVLISDGQLVKATLP